MVVVDASILLLFLNERASASVANGHRRVQHLIDTLSEAGERIIIPTPALSECLVHAGTAASDYVTIIEKNAASHVASFDQRAAIEAAISTYEAQAGDSRRAVTRRPTRPRSSTTGRSSPSLSSRVLRPSTATTMTS